MGTGSSKSKNGGNKVVVADVVVPGKSQPIKVTGQLDPSVSGQANGGHSSGGQAQVKKVAPNKYSLQMGEQSVGVRFKGYSSSLRENEE